MYYAVIRAILGDNCNMPAIKTPSPSSHGLLLKGTAWLYNYHSDWQGEGRRWESSREEIFQSGWTDQLPWTPCCSDQARSSCDIMPHSHTVSKIPWGPQLPLPTNECFCSLHSRMHANSSFLWGCSSPFYPLEMQSSVSIGMLEEHVFSWWGITGEITQRATISRASLLESHR